MAEKEKKPAKVDPVVVNAAGEQVDIDEKAPASTLATVDGDCPDTIRNRLKYGFPIPTGFSIAK